jgi:phage-related tail fiber protein
MLVDSLQIVEGAKIVNLTADSGTVNPPSAAVGGLFFRTDTESLYVHTGAQWSEIGALPQDISSTSQPTFAQVTVNADPDQAMEVATKQYVDSIAAGLDPKASVKAATTGAITLTGTQTVDGVSLVTGDRVLVKNQSPTTDNGIYVVASGAWARSTDMDGTPANEVSAGNYVFVEQGTQNASTGWLITGSGILTLGVDPIVWTQFSEVGQVTAGAGLTKTGSQVDVGTASTSRIVVNADNIDLATTGVGAGTYVSVAVDVYGRVTSGSATQDWSTIVNVPDMGFPSGTTMLFVQTAAPTGWTKSTTHNDKALRIVSGTASSGGTSAFSTVFGKTATNSYALVGTDLPVHSHTFSATTSSDGAHTHFAEAEFPGGTITKPYSTSDQTLTATNQVPNLQQTSSNGAHTHTISGTTGTTGSGVGHSHAMDIRVQYVDAIIAVKD